MDKKVWTIIVVVFLFSNTYLFQNMASGNFVNISIDGEEGDVLYVGDCGDYSKIQDAINDANDGDTVYVYPGIYCENILVNKKIDIIGINSENTIIYSSNISKTITITVDNVTVSGFTIKNAHMGMHIISNNSNIVGNNFFGNYYGIWIEKSNNTFISDNEFFNNSYFSICIMYCVKLKIENNTFFQNGFGIVGLGCHNCYVLSNNITDNTLGGVDFLYSSYNQLLYNRISFNYFGVWMGESTNNVIGFNEITKNFLGIKTSCSLDNEIHYNNIYENYHSGFDAYSQIAKPTYNWWGDVSGPERKPLTFISHGDNISSSMGFVYFRPYLRKPVDISDSDFENRFYKNSLIDLNKIEIFSNNIKPDIDNSEYIPDYIFGNEDKKYDLVIITPKKYELLLKPLLKHKNKIGINSSIVCLSDIYRSYQGYDKAEEIKLFIKDAVNNWSVKFVMLVGDVDDLPVRYVWSSGNKPVVSDLYYSDIFDSEGKFSSWDTNDNGFYGEFFHDGFTDEIDLVPDIGIGRLACENFYEVLIVVNKIISYESQKCDDSWFKRIIYCGGDSLTNFGDISEGEFLSNEIIKTMDDFTPIKLWMSNNQLSNENVTEEINKGAGFVFFSMHGGPIDLMTHSTDGKRFRYSIKDTLKLKNSDRLPIFYIDACLSAKIDYFLPCTAWSTVKKTGGGSIAAIGSTRVSMGFTDKNSYLRGSSKLALNFFNSYKNSTYLSEMFMNSIKEYIAEFGKDYTILQEQILLGDPSLKIGGYL